MRKIAIRYGLWMFAGFTLFFLLMHLLGLSEYYSLRIFNGVIHLSLIFLAIREYYQREHRSKKTYLDGVVMGFYASFIGVVAFAVFFTLFLALNPAFLDTLQERVALGKYLNPITTSIYILVEGIVISLIGSYIIDRVIERSPKYWGIEN